VHLLNGYHINKIYVNIKTIEEIHGLFELNFVKAKSEKDFVSRIYFKILFICSSKPFRRNFVLIVVTN
jgi:DeoR/GlpR family transcriptional regulator of sugar metabolism